MRKIILGYCQIGKAAGFDPVIFLGVRVPLPQLFIRQGNSNFFKEQPLNRKVFNRRFVERY